MGQQGTTVMPDSKELSAEVLVVQSIEGKRAKVAVA